MIYHYTSSRTVLARMSGMYTNSSWHQKAILFAADAIQQIGYASRDKDTRSQSLSISLVNHKAELPCDLEFLTKVEYNGCRIPLMRDQSLKSHICDDDYFYGKQGYGDFYQIDPPYIISTLDAVDIDLFYKAYEMDKHGWLMIPDYAEYKLAIQWYIISQLCLQGVYNKNNTSYEQAVAEFERYKNKAKRVVKRMSRDQRANFARMWNSMPSEFVTHSITDVQ